MKFRDMCTSTTLNSGDDHFQKSDMKFNQQTASEDIQFNRDISIEDTKVDFMRVVYQKFLNISKKLYYYCNDYCIIYCIITTKIRSIVFLL